MTAQARSFARPLPAESSDDSVTVAVTSRRLGCDPSTVRALVRSGELTGHRVGKGKHPKGIRVHLTSINDYRSRNAIFLIADNDNIAADKPTPRRNARRTAEHDEAIARLRAWGV